MPALVTDSGLCNRAGQCGSLTLKPSMGLGSQAGAEGAAAPGRREPADGGRAPPGTPARYARAERRGVERAAGEVVQQ